MPMQDATKPLADEGPVQRRVRPGAETEDARAAVNLALAEADPFLSKWSTDKERTEFAERRCKFWRMRCLEHAVEIDGLRATLGIALVALEYHRDQTRPTELSDEAISALRLVVGPNC